jgi:hypothetical protein
LGVLNLLPLEEGFGNENVNPNFQIRIANWSHARKGKKAADIQLAAMTGHQGLKKKQERNS